MEGIMFQRGKDPRKTMGVGAVNYTQVDEIRIEIYDENRNRVGATDLPKEKAKKFIEKIVDERKIDFDIIIGMFPEYGNYIRVELYTVKVSFLVRDPGGKRNELSKRQMYGRTIIYDGQYYELPDGRA